MTERREFADVDRYRSPGPKRVRFFCGYAEERKSLRVSGSFVVSRVRFDFPWERAFFETPVRMIPLGARSRPLLGGEPIGSYLGDENPSRSVRFGEDEFAIPVGDVLWAITVDVPESAGGRDLTCWLEGAVVPAVEVR